MSGCIFEEYWERNFNILILNFKVKLNYKWHLKKEFVYCISTTCFVTLQEMMRFDTQHPRIKLYSFNLFSTGCSCLLQIIRDLARVVLNLYLFTFEIIFFEIDNFLLNACKKESILSYPGKSFVILVATLRI